jgi:hypothetical protein
MEDSPFFFVGNFTLLQNLGISRSPNKNHPKKKKLKSPHFYTFFEELDPNKIK